jgi:hypothetical protein
MTALVERAKIGAAVGAGAGFVCSLINAAEVKLRGWEFIQATLISTAAGAVGGAAFLAIPGGASPFTIATIIVLTQPTTSNPETNRQHLIDNACQVAFGIAAVKLANLWLPRVKTPTRIPVRLEPKNPTPLSEPSSPNVSRPQTPEPAAPIPESAPTPIPKVQNSPKPQLYNKPRVGEDVVLKENVPAAAKPSATETGPSPFILGTKGQRLTLPSNSITVREAAEIQAIANKYNTTIDVVGSRAAGQGRNIGTDLPVGKEIRGGPPTRSDIDFRIDTAHPQAADLIKDLQGVGNGAGTAGPNWSTNPTTPRGRPTEPPLIRFNPQ